MNISIAAEPVAAIGSLTITNSIIVSSLAVVVLIVGALTISGSLKRIPGRVQGVCEVAFEGLLGMIDSVTGSAAQTRALFPLIATIFFLVLTVNWMGLLPGVGSVGIWADHHGEHVLVPLFRSASADLNFTIMLALVSVIMTQVVGITAMGFWKYASKFVNLAGLLRNPLKNGMNFVVGLLELFLEVMKVVSFAFRLFGNVFAGEVLLTVIMFLVPYLVPLPFLVLELFVGVIQAAVFAMLTLVFMKMATMEPHH